MSNTSVDEPLAPGIRQFVERLTCDYARFPDLGSASLEERRRIATEVRAPWSRGGPAMARTLDVEFDSAVGPIFVRVHMPAAEGPLPVLAYAHGGGWVMFSVDTHDRLLREYAARANVVVVGLEYSLAPEARYPRQVDEFRELVRWLQRGGLEGVIGEAIVLGGDSAGANLALATALHLREDPSVAKIKGLLLNYGAFDPHCDSDTYRIYAEGEYLLSAAEMRGFWDTYVSDGNDFSDPLVAPLKASLAGLPPCLLSIAEHDVLRDDSLALAGALHRAGVDTVSQVYPGTVHSFLEAVSVAPVSNQALDDAASWLNSHLANPKEKP